MPTISDRLVECRKALGLSQQAVADHVGIAARSQRNYESGERSPDADYLSALAVLGMDVLYLLTGQRSGIGEQAAKLTAEEEAMLGYFRDASKEARRKALLALLGESSPGANHVGGTHSQHSSGAGAIHIGGIGNKPPKRRG